MPHRFHARRRFASIRRRGATLAASALAATALLAAGCAATGGDEGVKANPRYGLLMAPADANRLGYSPTWATDLALRGRQRITHAVVLGDLLVTTEAPRPIATAIELDTGEVRWTRALGEGIAPLARPMRREDHVLFLVDATHLDRYDADTGELVDRQYLNHVVSSQPARSDTQVVYGTIKGRGVSHSLASGFASWEYSLVTEIAATPALDGDGVFLADQRGTYAMLVLSTGDLLWRGRAFDAVTADPAIADAGVLLPCTDGTLYVLDQTTGRDQWVHRTTTPLTQPASQFGPNVYLPVPGRATLALDALTGEELWRAPAGTMPLRLDGDGDRLLAVRGDTLVQLDPADGREIDAARAVDPVDVVEGPAGSLLLVTDRGRVLRLNPTP